jgi:hypothetical protein
VGVVAVVLVDPPAERQPNREVAVQQPDQPVGPTGPEDLPVAGVMAEEPGLGEDHGQVPGGGQLPPRIAQQHEDRPPGDDQQRIDGDFRRVVSRVPVEQTFPRTRHNSSA